MCIRDSSGSKAGGGGGSSSRAGGLLSTTNTVSSVLIPQRSSLLSGNPHPSSTTNSTLRRINRHTSSSTTTNHQNANSKSGIKKSGYGGGSGGKRRSLDTNSSPSTSYSGDTETSTSTKKHHSTSASSSAAAKRRRRNQVRSQRLKILAPATPPVSTSSILSPKSPLRVTGGYIQPPLDVDDDDDNDTRIPLHMMDDTRMHFIPNLLTENTDADTFATDLMLGVGQHAFVGSGSVTHNHPGDGAGGTRRGSGGGGGFGRTPLLGSGIRFKRKQSLSSHPHSNSVTDIQSTHNTNTAGGGGGGGVVGGAPYSNSTSGRISEMGSIVGGNNSQHQFRAPHLSSGASPASSPAHSPSKQHDSIMTSPKFKVATSNNNNANATTSGGGIDAVETPFSILNRSDKDSLLAAGAPTPIASDADMRQSTPAVPIVPVLVGVRTEQQRLGARASAAGGCIEFAALNEGLVHGRALFAPKPQRRGTAAEKSGKSSNNAAAASVSSAQARDISPRSGISARGGIGGMMSGPHQHGSAASSGGVGKTLSAISVGTVTAQSTSAPSTNSTKAPPAVSYTHLRAHETPEHLVCRLLLEKKKQTHQ
eukprot:TRINITY_DN13156_c0_g1_i2.p1 TRINITY_DN13156_c0_g1~~TRINITY_DN13156_c0_g1_i2.p1  ORF type:complete len:592 (-),score=116.94 TRINITY_DN13156_c0_g1_i2:49-1824(-)